MGALEAVARDLAGDAKLTLGEVLKRHPGLLPRPLDSALGQIWGYALNEVRHVEGVSAQPRGSGVPGRAGGGDGDLPDEEAVAPSRSLRAPGPRYRNTVWIGPKARAVSKPLRHLVCKEDGFAMRGKPARSCCPPAIVRCALMENRLIPISEREFRIYALSLQPPSVADSHDVEGAWKSADGSCVGALLVGDGDGRMLILRRQVDARFVVVAEERVDLVRDRHHGPS